jgi:hypothetical protein
MLNGRSAKPWVSNGFNATLVYNLILDDLGVPPF